ncbi:MAG TPA: hypothetical protein VGK74_10395 [Symbiobacteriaceae bacterium]|jgi:Uri superfamily endonuclease
MMPAKVIPISRARVIVRQRQKRQPKAKSQERWLITFLNKKVSVAMLLLAVAICGAVVGVAVLTVRNSSVIAEAAMNEP